MPGRSGIHVGAELMQKNVYVKIMIITSFPDYLDEAMDFHVYRYYMKLDIENPIIRINTAFKGCSSLEKISVLPRIYHN